MTQRKTILKNQIKIWDEAPHCALTDLIRYNGYWFCTFRESDSHVYGKDGMIRIILSEDCSSWNTVATFSEKGQDFRDPKFSLTPDGRLMLLIGATVYEDKTYISRQPRVCFSDDGKKWSAWKPILEPHDWLWRVTWNKGKAYGVSYSKEGVKLFVSSDGVDYSLITEWDIPGYPNETTLRFLDDKMIALVRRDGRRDNHAWIGMSEPPYTDWDWKDSGHYFGGPNFLILPDGTFWAAGRLLENTPYGQFEKTAVAEMGWDHIRPVLILPSGGDDTSYPGMVYHEGELWVSYYSSHEGSTAIYLAQVSIN